MIDNNTQTPMAHFYPVIQFSNVSKRFGSNVALNNVSLAVPPGKVFALLGENGAGKTTAIRIMLGMALADMGQSTVVGLDSRQHDIEIRRQVGYVPEHPVLYDWMTVQQTGWFAAGFYPPAYWSEYCRLIADFKIPMRRKIRSLSKGMRAKVSLSLALAHDPNLLILDEPTSGLDAMIRREFLESMVDRAASGRSVFLSSHQINEVERVADFIAIMRGGQILLVEPLDQLKESTRQLIVTGRNMTDELPVPQATIIERRDAGRQTRLIVRDFGTEEQLSSIRDHESVESVEIRRPSLEEIFIAYMQQPKMQQQPVPPVSQPQQPVW